MPRQSINYDNTVFYKIVCRDLSKKEVYVGHTTDFRKRKTQHKHYSSNNDSNNLHYHTHIYTFIRNHGGWNNFDMVMIEQCKCENSLDAHRKEREYIEQLNATLNYNVPSRSKSEWSKQWYESHQEQIHLYRETHKEVIAAQQSAKYNRNKEHLLETQTCCCGGKFVRMGLARHSKTKRHQEYLATLPYGFVEKV